VTELNYGPAFQKVEGFELVAVMRRDKDKCADYARRHNVKKYYTDADSLINDPDVDAVYIATPPDSHKLYAMQVAKAGKPCCIEKPMAPSYEESLELYNTFVQANVPLFVAYYRRSLPRFQTVKRWLRDLRIGSVRHINWCFLRSPSAIDKSGADNWRTDFKVATCGYFDDMASHGIDLFEYLLGEIKDVSGFVRNQQGLYTANDSVTACWMHKNGGVTGSLQCNLGCSARQEMDRVEIVGSKGKIEFSIIDQNVIRLTTLVHDVNNARLTSTLQEELFIPNPENVHLAHVESMRDHLFGLGECLSTGLTALHTGWVLDRMTGRLGNGLI
jgi:1,5-anhydro-D-fructose reductase (1,5-anhydro-D-mannitol-forming)